MPTHKEFPESSLGSTRHATGRRYPRIMGLMERVVGWMDRHTVIVDLLLFLPLCVLTGMVIVSTENAQGLLFSVSDIGQVIWSQIYILPLAMRRRYPQIAALTFVGLCMLHMIFGPSIMLTDVVALVMLYSVIVYGDPRNTRAFIALSFMMSLIATAVITSSYTIGPLFSDAANTTGWLGYDSCPSNSPDLVPWPCIRDVSANATAVLLLFLICLVAVIIMAFWQRARLYTIRMMQERNASLEARQREEARIAALAERRRIARDMHDVVAHTLSTIIVQSDAGRYAGSHDLGIARSTMQTIDRESDAALRNMRQLLGIFEDSPADIPRMTGGHATTPLPEATPLSSNHSAFPQVTDDSTPRKRTGSADSTSVVQSGETAEPSFETIDELIREHDSLPGNPGIVHHVDGTPRSDALSPAASTAAYRMVQESFSNINKYAGDDVQVLLRERWSNSGLHISIQDNGLGMGSTQDGHQPGFGLLGMKERVEALGGRVQAGPMPQGGFLVEAELPLSHASHQETSGTEDTHNPGLKERITEFFHHLRSKPFEQASSASGKRFNLIERLSQWSERHYTLIDTLIMAVIIVLGIWSQALWSGLVTFSDILPITEKTAPVGAAFVIFALVAPLCFRRRFPQTTAGIVVVACVLQLLCVPDVYLVNILALLYLHAVILLGPSSRIRWTVITTFAMCVLLGVKLFVAEFWGYPTLLLAMFKSPLVNSSSTDSLSTSLTASVVIGLGTLALCSATTASALWTRTKGNNALVLREREEALRDEEEQQRRLAASVERDRIGNAIQHEVTSTLQAVRRKAIDGLDNLDTITDTSQKEVAQNVQDSFAAIGKEGRLALAHMRRLLRILRESKSDAGGETTSGTPQDGMDLAPAPTLEEQLKHLARVTSSDSGTR